MVQLKRIYEEPAGTDGFRVLVDRLWPRGVSKDKAKIDLWLKDVAPSPELREWFGHKSERFDEFRRKYLAELAGNPAVTELERLIGEHQIITLLYATKDPTHSNASVLIEYLEARQ